MHMNPTNTNSAKNRRDIGKVDGTKLHGIKIWQLKFSTKAKIAIPRLSDCVKEYLVEDTYCSTLWPKLNSWQCKVCFLVTKQKSSTQLANHFWWPNSTRSLFPREGCLFTWTPLPSINSLLFREWNCFAIYELECGRFFISLWHWEYLRNLPAPDVRNLLRSFRQDTSYRRLGNCSETSDRDAASRRSAARSIALLRSVGSGRRIAPIRRTAHIHVRIDTNGGEKCGLAEIPIQ